MKFGAAPGLMFMYLEAFGPCKLNSFYLQLGSQCESHSLFFHFSEHIQLHLYPLWLLHTCQSPRHKCEYTVVVQGSLYCIYFSSFWHCGLNCIYRSKNASRVCVIFFFSSLTSKLQLSKLFCDWHLLWRFLNDLDAVTFTHLLLL